MGEAEDAIRARLAASEQEAKDVERARQDEQAWQVERVRAAVPTLLRALEAKGYPNGELIPVTTASGHRFFSGKRWATQEEKAAWKLFSRYQVDAPRMTMWLTVDGRFAWDSPGLYGSLSYVALEWIAESPSMLAETAAGLERLLTGHR